MESMVAFADNTDSLLKTPPRARAQDRSGGSSASRCSKSFQSISLREPISGRCSRLGTCSRDPIGYVGSKWSLSEYVASSPLSYFDPEGLTFGDCMIDWPDPCDHEPRTPEACCAGMDNGDAGGVVCCDGRKVACVWPQNIPGGLVDPAKKIIHDCVLSHELEHIPDVSNCRVGRCVVEQKRGKFGLIMSYDSECRAHRRELVCLLGHQRDCNGDSFCLSQIRLYIRYLLRPNIERYCWYHWF